MKRPTAQAIGDKQGTVYALNHALPILELSALPQFQPKPSWIRKALRNRPSLAHVGRCLRALLRVGLLNKDETGLIKPTAHSRKTTTPPPKAARAYHQRMLREAARAVEELPTSQRHISSVTLTLSKAQYEEVCATMDALRAKMMKMEQIQSSAHREVYFIGLAVLPLTETRKP